MEPVLPPETIDSPLALPAPVRKPNWLRVKLPTGDNYRKVRGLVDNYKLHTICESGRCPNMGECWGEGTATFMILGNTCTRSCGFCNVATGRPDAVDWDEPERVARGTWIDTHHPDFLLASNHTSDKLLNLGNALQSDGRSEEAIRAFRQAIALNPALPQAHTGLGVALQGQGQAAYKF